MNTIDQLVINARHDALELNSKRLGQCAITLQNAINGRDYVTARAILNLIEKDANEAWSKCMEIEDCLHEAEARYGR